MNSTSFRVGREFILKHAPWYGGFAAAYFMASLKKVFGR